MHDCSSFATLDTDIPAWSQILLAWLASLWVNPKPIYRLYAFFIHRMKQLLDHTASFYRHLKLLAL